MNAIDRAVLFLTVLLIGGLVVFLLNPPDTSSSDEAGGTTDQSPADRGKAVFQREGCQACHTVQGGEGVGPSMKGLFGSKQTVQDGTTVLVDRKYIRESIRHPDRTVVKGYPANMPSYDHLSSDEIDVLVAYIASRSEKTIDGKDHGNK